VKDHTFPVACDLGAGFAAPLLNHARAGIKKMYFTDMSQGMLQRNEWKDVERIVADEEALPFPPASLDLVLANVSLHWVNDLPGALAQIRTALRPDGMLLGAMLGGRTLHELRSALMLAEQEREGGIGVHVSPFAGVADVGNLLSQAGFTLSTVDTESLLVHYPDALHLMHDLRGMAENNCVRIRRLHVPRATFEAAAAIYQQLYSTNDSHIPATFQVIYFVGWAPAPTQAKPKPRGSAKVSFKTLS